MKTAQFPVAQGAQAYASYLLGQLGCSMPVAEAVNLEPGQGWRDAGMACLNPQIPPLRADPVTACADGALLALESLSGRTTGIVGRRALGMRLHSHPLMLPGRVSAGGSCQLLDCEDGRLALNLSRNEDWDMMPAWLEIAEVSDWEDIKAELAHRCLAEMLERGRLLGLPIASAEGESRAWFQIQQIVAPKKSPARAPRILDISALWAGPLCTQLLCRLGADVCKIEHPERPDGARRGPAAFFEFLHKTKTEERLDLRSPSGREAFLALLANCDVVVESLRPRAWEQLDLAPAHLLAEFPGLSWLSITGYGRTGEQGDWVAFGDDAAVAAGFSQWAETQCGEAQFVGDALADPLTGLHAALAAWHLFASGGGQIGAVALRDVAAQVLDWTAD